MITPFNVLEKEILPKVNVYIVQKVNKPQSLLAEKLGITQAMVSKYLSKKERDFSELIKKIGNKQIEIMQRNLSKEDSIKEITEICYEVIQNGELCDVCSKINDLKGCKACMNIIINDEKKKIIENLKLKRPIYQKTASYGHFGREDPDFTWEKKDKVEELRKASGL